MTGSQGLEIHHNEFNLNGGSRVRPIEITGNTGATFLRIRVYNNVIYGKGPRAHTGIRQPVP